jgi:hypothetical protein
VLRIRLQNRFQMRRNEIRAVIVSGAEQKASGCAHALMRVRVRSVLRVWGFAHAKRPIFPGDFHEINDDILRADAGRLGEQFGDALE